MATVNSLAEDLRFFHFEVAWPEVFTSDHGGFDVVIGNPPYLGGKKISTVFGDKFLKFLKAQTPESADATDLAAYFVRRAYDLLAHDGDLGFITTNSIAEGDTRAASLGPVTEWGGTIAHAVRSEHWEGSATVAVSVIHVHEGPWTDEKTLNGEAVATISPALTDEEEFLEAVALPANAGYAFVGTFVRGSGFVLEPDAARRLIEEEPQASQVVVRYWTAEDVTRCLDVSPSRFVINFMEMSLEEAEKYPDPPGHRHSAGEA